MLGAPGPTGSSTVTTEPAPAPSVSRMSASPHAWWVPGGRPGGQVVSITVMTSPYAT